MRPHQWLKNGLIFLPLIAGHSLDEARWLNGLVAFISFSLAASAIYVINDLLDLRHDRLHPYKRNRPFAAGEAPVMAGVALAPVLLGASMLIGYVLLPLSYLTALAIYCAIALLYSLLIKRVAILDVLALSVLFNLRILAGAAATGIVLSPWLLTFTGFLFFSLACVKRHVEIHDLPADQPTKVAGRGYESTDLPLIRTMSATSGYSAVLVVALYINSDAVVLLYKSPLLLWAICPVLLYWISRIFLLTERGKLHDDPVVFAARDPVTWLIVLICAGIFLASSAGLAA